jgi:hypothetical protein
VKPRGTSSLKTGRDNLRPQRAANALSGPQGCSVVNTVSHYATCSFSAGNGDIQVSADYL